MELIPIGNRVVVEQLPAETKTASGIIIPDTAQEKPLQGRVIAAGPGLKDEEMTVKAGDVVLYSKYGGSEVKLEGKEYILLRETDIYAIVK